jgi:hypothetical protein
MFEVESTMHPLAILQAQSGPFLLDLLAALTEIAPIGAITLLRPSLFLRRPRLGCVFALRIAFLFSLIFGTRPLFAPALLLGRPLPVLSARRLGPPIGFAVLWLRASIGFAATSGRFSAITMLRLIAAWSAQLTARRAATARPMHAATTRSAGPVHTTASAGCAARRVRTAAAGPTLAGAAAFMLLS